MLKVAINGFGRIGRGVFKILAGNSKIRLVAVNDLTDARTLAHLLKYDSVYGIYGKAIRVGDGEILVNSEKVKIFSEKDPGNLPWKKLGIDVVLECTGVFRKYEDARKHLVAGAKKVIISAPSKSPGKIASFVLGVNENVFDSKKHDVVDMASCTTNCLAPVAKALDDAFGIVKGFMTTVHSYTTSQNLLDLPHRDLRRARAAAINVVPTTTGATEAIGRVIPGLEGKMDGMALRVPVPTVSLIDLVCETEKKAGAEEVNYAFKKASRKKELKGILGIEDAPLVSTDYIGNSFSAVVDAPSTRAAGNMVKVVAWYDNEYGYNSRLAEFAEFVGRKL